MRVIFAILVLIIVGDPSIAAPVAPQEIEVIDGDTVRHKGVVYRLVGCDTPEINQRARCEIEHILGITASRRLRELLNTGKAELEPVACSCRKGTEGTWKCNWGRSCAKLINDGVDACQTLIQENLARRYVCSPTRCPKTKSWC